MTEAPSAQNMRQATAPIPPAAPVITACFPASLCTRVPHAACDLRDRSDRSNHRSVRGRPCDSAWWPRSEWRADLPLVAERVDDPAEPPAVLVRHRRGFRRTCGYGLSDDRVGVLDHEQHPAGRAVDRA